MLRRVKGRIVHMVLSRVSPLAVPVLLEIGRESVRSGDAEEAMLAEAGAGRFVSRCGWLRPAAA
jgi:ATP-dependent Lhr-like helicase